MNEYLKNRLANLETHLKAENPDVVEVLPTYFKLDKMLYRMGVLDRETSLAGRISWWPLIAILGTFSAGKSTFINDYVGEKLQGTGNQAVDDKFTVICYGKSGQTLPGTALDADPRFPFYRMSREIEKVAPGEGKRIESYLQLRTTDRDKIKGKILIDSPGFDADDQRRSTLRLTDHIIDLSDLVLVFFDARHPEPGAMQDTLEHLVARTKNRTDATKFFYILNQMDTAAREDNPEEVVGAWQRALAQAGLTAGRFFTIYNEGAAVPIEDGALRERFSAKRDTDLAAIHRRMDEVEVQRNYRIVSMLETVANTLEDDMVPRLRQALARWRRLVLIGDGIALAVMLLAVPGAMIGFGWWPAPEVFGFDWIKAHLPEIGAGLLALLVMAGSYHFWMRTLAAGRVAATLTEAFGQMELDLRTGFRKSTAYWRPLFAKNPAGWGKGAMRRLRGIREGVALHIQHLNDRYADPSGKSDQTDQTDQTVEGGE